MAGSGLALIEPDWPAPANVRAVSTTRAGGVSEGPYASLNLGAHVDDDPRTVQSNRNLLTDALGIDEPRWLDQVHGVQVAAAESVRAPVAADASITTEANVVCAVMTADCLPLLLCDRDGTTVAAVHGGWRGLAAGIVEAAVDAFAGRGVDAGRLIAWLGPAIGAEAYEVGSDVRDALDRAGDRAALVANPRGRWQLDLCALARSRLEAAGVSDVHGGGFCTHADAARFFSYRRDGTCGRMATLVWLTH